MKTTLIVILSLILATTVFAQVPAQPSGSGMQQMHQMPMSQGMGDSMSCPMVQRSKDMNQIIIDMLKIQERLAAGMKDTEKTQILGDIEAVKAKLQQMVAEPMSCPMMKMHQMPMNQTSEQTPAQGTPATQPTAPQHVH